MVEDRPAKDRIKTCIETGNPPVRVHCNRTPSDLLTLTSYTLTRDEYYAAREDKAPGGVGRSQSWHST